MGIVKVNGKSLGTSGISIPTGEIVIITPDYGAGFTGSGKMLAQYTFDYLDYAGLQKTVTISCKNLGY